MYVANEVYFAFLSKKYPVATLYSHITRNTEFKSKRIYL